VRPWRSFCSPPTGPDKRPSPAWEYRVARDTPALRRRSLWKPSPLVEAVSLVISEQTVLRVVSVVAAATVVLAAVVIAVRGRTPTDLVLPVAFLVLVPRGILMVLVVVMSLGSRLIATVDSLYVDEAISRPICFLVTWLGAVRVPLLAVLVFRLVDFGEVVAIRSRRRYGSSEP
jgi:hypothetical protein